MQSPGEATRLAELDALKRAYKDAKKRSEASKGDERLAQAYREAKRAYKAASSSPAGAPGARAAVAAASPARSAPAALAAATNRRASPEEAPAPAADAAAAKPGAEAEPGAGSGSWAAEVERANARMEESATADKILGEARPQMRAQLIVTVQKSYLDTEDALRAALAAVTAAGELDSQRLLEKQLGVVTGRLAEIAAEVESGEPAPRRTAAPGAGAAGEEPRGAQERPPQDAEAEEPREEAPAGSPQSERGGEGRSDYATYLMERQKLLHKRLDLEMGNGTGGHARAPRRMPGSPQASSAPPRRHFAERATAHVSTQREITARHPRRRRQEATDSSVGTVRPSPSPRRRSPRNLPPSRSVAANRPAPERSWRLTPAVDTSSSRAETRSEAGAGRATPPAATAHRTASTASITSSSSRPNEGTPPRPTPPRSVPSSPPVGRAGSPLQREELSKYFEVVAQQTADELRRTQMPMGEDEAVQLQEAWTKVLQQSETITLKLQEEQESLSKYEAMTDQLREVSRVAEQRSAELRVELQASEDRRKEAEAREEQERAEALAAEQAAKETAEQLERVEAELAAKLAEIDGRPSATPGGTAGTVPAIGAAPKAVGDDRRVSFTVHVVSARNLPKMDRMGQADPYVKLRCGGDTFETDVVRNTLSPKWSDARYQFDNVRSSEVLSAELWDKDRGSKDDPMGRISVPLTEYLDDAKSGSAFWFALEPMSGCEQPRGELQVRCTVLSEGHMWQTRDERAAPERVAEAPAPAPQAKAKAVTKTPTEAETEAELELELKRLEVVQFAASEMEAADSSPRTLLGAVAAHQWHGDSEAVQMIKDTQDLLEDKMLAEKTRKHDAVKAFYESKGYVDMLAEPPPQTTFDISFTEAGSLGLRLTDKSGAVKVLSMVEGSQATNHSRLRPGLELIAIDGASIRGIVYAQVLDMLRQAGRPVVLSFRTEKPVQPAAPAAKVEKVSVLVPLEPAVVVDIIQPGRLGIAWLQAVDEDYSDAAYIKGTIAGSQAEAMSELRPGLVLGTVHVNGVGGSVAGLEYPEILAQLRNEGRPLTLGFDRQLAPDGVTSVQPNAAGAGGRRMVRALYPWNESAGAAPDDLMFEAGDEIEVIREEGDGWLTGARAGAQGMFPSNYVEETVAGPPQESAAPLPPPAAAAAPVSATFTQPGSLGIRFTPFPEGQRDATVVRILSIDPNKQAAQHPQLQVGLTLTAVGATSVEGVLYQDVITMIKAQGRPLDMQFSSAAPAGAGAATTPAPQPQPEAEPAGVAQKAPVSVTFAQPGSLGIRFTPNPPTNSGAVQILSIDPNKQAAQHPQLQVGMMLTAVGAQQVAGMPYKQVIAMIKEQGRPLDMQFSSTAPAGATAAPASQRAPGPAPAPVPASAPQPEPELTGKAAAKALQQLIATKGTSDVNTIAKLRRASLQPDATPMNAPGPLSAAAAMAAAAAEIDGEDEQASAPPPEAAFVPPPRPVGAKQIALAREQRQKIEAIYAEHHPQKVGEVGALIEQYGEAELLRQVRETYNVAAKELAEIKSLYTRFEPPKLAQVDSLVAKYGEQDLLRMVRKKYRAQIHREQCEAEVYKFLGSLRAAQHTKQVVESLADSHPDPRSWVPELRAMQGNGTLQDFLQACQAMADLGGDEDEPQAVEPKAPQQPSQQQLEIQALYQRYNPAKLQDVPTLVAKYGEGELLRMVRKKYRAEEQRRAHAQALNAWLVGQGITMPHTQIITAFDSAGSFKSGDWLPTLQSMPPAQMQEFLHALVTQG